MRGAALGDSPNDHPACVEHWETSFPRACSSDLHKSKIQWCPTLNRCWLFCIAVDVVMMMVLVVVMGVVMVAVVLIMVMVRMEVMMVMMMGVMMVMGVMIVAVVLIMGW